MCDSKNSKIWLSDCDHTKKKLNELFEKAESHFKTLSESPIKHIVPKNIFISGDIFLTTSLPGGKYGFNLTDIELKEEQRIAFSEGTFASKTWQVSSNIITYNGIEYNELTADITLQPNYCAYVRESLPDSEDKKWNNSDVWFNGTVWSTGQQRVKVI